MNIKKVFSICIYFQLSAGLFAQDGESFTFTKLDSSDWTLEENQDRITDNVWITRKHTQSIFNIVQEENYQEGSPMGTSWARNSTDNALTEDYTNFVAMHGGGGGGGPQSLIGDTVSLHIDEDDLYFDVIFHSWTGSNQGGGFSYTRIQVGSMEVSNFGLLEDFMIHSAYPNPFNPITTLSYDLPEDNFVVLTIYDIMGTEITKLVNTSQTTGMKSVQWDATDSMGRQVSAGVYLYQIQAGEFVQTKKMVLLK